MKESGTPFFLTGGTALSRFYYNHRYSEDLDFFVQNDEDYSYYVKSIISDIKKSEKISIDLSQVSIGGAFTRLIVTDLLNKNVELQIDLVNDVVSHEGGFIEHPDSGTIDSWKNILTNKLTALFRSEPKDVVDIWTIAKNQSFRWEEIVLAAKSKEAGIEPEIIYRILKSFPVLNIEPIKWVKKPDSTTFMSELGVIADDILYGEQNSLHL